MNTGYDIESRYELVGRQYVCAYCGDPAETIDHCLPRSHVHEHRRAYACYKIIKVPACQHCNSILGTKIFDTFSQRKEWVHKRLRQKFKKELAFLAWDQNESKTMGRGLRDRIKQGMANAQWAVRRIWFASIPTTADVPDQILRRVEREDGEELRKPVRPSNAEIEKGAA